MGRRGCPREEGPEAGHSPQTLPLTGPVTIIWDILLTSAKTYQVGCIDSNSQGPGGTISKEKQCGHILYVHESLYLISVLKARETVYSEVSPFRVS